MAIGIKRSAIWRECGSPPVCCYAAFPRGGIKRCIPSGRASRPVPPILWKLL